MFFDFSFIRGSVVHQAVYSNTEITLRRLLKQDIYRNKNALPFALSRAYIQPEVSITVIFPDSSSLEGDSAQEYRYVQASAARWTVKEDNRYDVWHILGSAYPDTG